MKWYRKFFALRKHKRHNLKKIDDGLTEEQRMQKRAEREKRREAYESKYLNVRPAKLMRGNYSREDVLQIKENSHEDLKYAEANESRPKTEDQTMNDYAADLTSQTYNHRPVNKDKELQKAHALRKQLEYEEEEKYRRRMSDN